MSMWVYQNDNDEYVDYFSLKKLQHETKQLREKYNIPEPCFYDLKTCFNCHQKFTDDDVFDFYSNKDYEYCKHQQCNLDEFIYEKKNLKLADLQEAISYGGIDYSNDIVIPPYIKRIYLYNTTEELDLSQTCLESINANGYYPLIENAFSSVLTLNICNNIVDFSKFINLTKLDLSYASNGDNIDLSFCKKLESCSIKNIQLNTNISLENCNKLHTLLLENISNINVNLKNCCTLHSLTLCKTKFNLDLSDCINIKHLKLDNSETVIQPLISLEKLNIINPNKDFDLLKFPNIKTLTFDLFAHIGNLLNLNKLFNLHSYTFNDYNSINNTVHNIDISENINLEHLNIYSAKNKCNIEFGTKLHPKLNHCKLDFHSDQYIYIPGYIKNIQMNRVNYMYT